MKFFSTCVASWFFWCFGTWCLQFCIRPCRLEFGKIEDFGHSARAWVELDRGLDFRPRSARPGDRFPTLVCSTLTRASRPNFLKCSKGRVCAGRGGRLTTCSCNIRLYAQNDSWAKAPLCAKPLTPSNWGIPHLMSSDIKQSMPPCMLSRVKVLLLLPLLYCMLWWDYPLLGFHLYMDHSRRLLGSDCCLGTKMACWW